MLRSLIELSYESSIMATALDVAEAVTAVLPPPRPEGPGTHLDDVIRKQLGAAQEKSVARRTAVTNNKPSSTETAATRERGEVSTGLFRKIGDDGLSRLEEIEPGTSSPDSGLHKLLDAHFDPDRRTEVGGPPTGQVPKSEPGTSEVPKSVTTDVGPARKPSRAPLIVVGAIVVAGGAAGIYVLTRSEPAKVIAPVTEDAKVEDKTGTLEVVSNPAGAHGKITGANGLSQEFGPTPVKLSNVPAGKIHVHVELDGYAPFEDDIELTPGALLRSRATLQAARASLHVVTVPSGAQVSLAGKLLGETELHRDDLSAAKGADLVLTHAGYEVIHQKVDLVAGRTTEVSETLKAAQKIGQIRISVTDGWGEVYFKGAHVGKAGPGATIIRLPVGQQTLQLKNNGKTWNVSCNVETDLTTCPTQMP